MCIDLWKQYGDKKCPVCRQGPDIPTVNTFDPERMSSGPFRNAHNGEGFLIPSSDDIFDLHQPGVYSGDWYRDPDNVSRGASASSEGPSASVFSPPERVSTSKTMEDIRDMVSAKRKERNQKK